METPYDEKTLKALREAAEFEAKKRKLIEKGFSLSVDFKEVRIKTGLSQKEFSAVYNLPLGFIKNLEQGRRGKKRPSVSVILLYKIIESRPLWIAEQVAKIRKEKNEGR